MQTKGLCLSLSRTSRCEGLKVFHRLRHDQSVRSAVEQLIEADRLAIFQEACASGVRGLEFGSQNLKIQGEERIWAIKFQLT